MAVNEDYLAFVQDQITLFAPVTTKRMFGGVGFFKEGIMFAMIAHNLFRLRGDESTLADFEAHGITKRFMEDEKKKGLPYYEVPLEVLEDKDELLIWMEKAYAIALKAKGI